VSDPFPTRGVKEHKPPVRSKHILGKSGPPKRPPPGKHPPESLQKGVPRKGRAKTRCVSKGCGFDPKNKVEFRIRY